MMTKFHINQVCNLTLSNIDSIQKALNRFCVRLLATGIRRAIQFHYPSIGITLPRLEWIFAPMDRAFEICTLFHGER